MCLAVPFFCLLVFVCIYRSHKEEVKAVLASEPGLVEEIDFDLRRFEKQEEERKKAEVFNGTPGYCCREV